MEHIEAGRIPQLPRSVLASPIFPLFLTEKLSPVEAATARLIFDTEIGASRPSWQVALAGALAALGGAS